jgi:hypothetical protein
MTAIEAALPNPSSVMGQVARAAEATTTPLSAARIVQERALVRLQLEEMVAKIKRRAQAQALNRGLSLSLPYFDEQALEVRWRELEIVPPGRVMFVPAFVVLAARREKERVTVDPKLSDETKQHLLSLLDQLERAFGPAQ